MKMGAEPKKLAWLGGLFVVAIAVYLYNSSDSASAPAPVHRPAAVMAPANAPGNNDTIAKANRTRVTSQNGNGEFKPGIGPKRGQTRPDPAKMDPTLRLDLLAKVQGVQPESALRNLFQFGAAQATVKPLPVMPAGVPKIITGPKPPVVVAGNTPSGPPQPPPPPPMTFKYYGYKLSKVNGIRQAFLLDGEDIIVAGENDLVKKRYKIVKIGANSITIEDTQFQHSQTLPLQEDVVA